MPTSIPATTLDKFSSFGDLLRFLRRRVGLTQMDLAREVGYSDTQISRLEQNLRLPDIPTVQDRFVSALGIEDDPKTIARLLELAANVRRDDTPAPGLCPYQGLNYFDEADADFFVGRELLTAKLTERVLALPGAKPPSAIRFLAIVGASGSGKSSLVRAGLGYSLRWNQVSTNWQIYIMTPSAHPLENLAVMMAQEDRSTPATVALLDDLASDTRSLHLFVKRKLRPNHGSQICLIIDQFEELFALCRSEEERAAFIENILIAATEADGPVSIIITLRADFYAHCAIYPHLREALAKQQEYIGAMNHQELRRAIEEPAERGRWDFEPGLIDLLLHDVGHEPGVLPLLSHALYETWQRRRGRTMTLSGYTASGGVYGAIAETAEAVFADQFTPEQQEIARRIFLRLTELGDESGAGDTRRRATFNELILKPEHATTTRAVLKALADARLIITSEDSAEVAHEALIREWPTLLGWLEGNRADLRLHRQLTEAANDWSKMAQDSDLLYRGARLAQAREWAATHEDELNALENVFLAASVEAGERLTIEREAQQRRELEAARKLVETEKARAEEQSRSADRLRIRNRIVSIVGTVAIMLAILAGALGYRSNQNAVHADQNAQSAQYAQATAQAASTEALADFTRSEALRLAAEANSLQLSNSPPELVALLGLSSLNLIYSPSGDAVLTNVTLMGSPPRELQGHTKGISIGSGVAFSPDGEYLASASEDMTARLWDLSSGETVRIFSGHTDELLGIAFSPDGKTLATTSLDGTAKLWDVATGEVVRTLAGPTGVIFFGIDFSPDGKTILTGSDFTGDNTARLWDVTTGQMIQEFVGHTQGMMSVDISPDGRLVATAGRDGTARLWEAATGKQLNILTGHENEIAAIRFSPDSSLVATSGDDQIIRLWDTGSGQLIGEYVGHKAWVQTLAFSPDGKYLLSGSNDQTARLWDVASGQPVHDFVHPDSVDSVAFSPDSGLMATGSSDTILRLWSLQENIAGTRLVGHTGPVWAASYSPDGGYMVTASDDRTARLWDATSGQEVRQFVGHTDVVRDAIFSPDGKTVLTASGDGTARLWDAATGQELRRFEGHTALVNRAAFSPDGHYLVTSSYDGTARVWDVQSARPITIYPRLGPGDINRVAFSPDGKWVVTSGQDDHTARIWDPLTGADLRVITTPGGVAGVAFSPDSKMVVTASGSSGAHLWDIASGQQVGSFIGHQGGVLGVSFSPDGRYLVTSGTDATARIWEVSTGSEIRRFTGHTGPIRSVVFSPDGQYILTASEDNTARAWLVDLDDTIGAACAMLIRDLTPEEREIFGITDQGPTCPP